MSFRLLALVTVCAAIACATPITLTFSGTADGSLNGVAFTAQAFTFTFTTDTTDLITDPNPSDPNDIVTPSAADATFSIGMGGDIGAGTFADNQSVFENPTPVSNSGTVGGFVGIWHYNTPDWLTLFAPEFASTASDYFTIDTTTAGTYTFTNGDPTTPTSGGAMMVDVGSSTTPVDLLVSDVTSPTFSETVTAASTGTPPPTGGAAPEPSTISFLLIGGAGLALGVLRRRRAKA
jgi:PEP-CTERM motif